MVSVVTFSILKKFEFFLLINLNWNAFGRKKIIELQTGAISEVQSRNVSENFGMKICGSEIF